MILAVPKNEIFCLFRYLMRCFYSCLQTEKEIATLEGDIKELKDAIDAKNAPMMVKIILPSFISFII